MADGFAIRAPALLEHGADQIDASARRVVPVAGEHIGGAHVRAGTVLHPGLQHPARVCRPGIRQLRQGEVGAHQLASPGLRRWSSARDLPRALPPYTADSLLDQVTPTIREPA